MLPLIGRIADLRGRLPVLVAPLLVFGFGSLITAAAYDLPSLVTGRFLQGVGGGGLVPVTLALVADIYPVEKRGVPLGIVGAVQELGSVIGPLYGAVVLAVGDWRDIFWINLAVGLVLAAGIAALGRGSPCAEPIAAAPRPHRPHPRRPLDHRAAAGDAPAGHLVTSVDWGGPFVPFGSSTSIWWSQVGLVADRARMLCWLAGAAGRDRSSTSATGGRPLRQADLLGALLLAVALGGVILAFATADPRGPGLLRPPALVPGGRRGRRGVPSSCTSAARPHR